MDELNNKIITLFELLINSGTEYLTKIDYITGNFYYKIKDKEIGLIVCSKRRTNNNEYTTIDQLRNNLYNYYVATPVEDNFCFIIVIDNKQYVVPNLSRVKEAAVLDKIDTMLKAKESEDLDSILAALTSNEEF